MLVAMTVIWMISRALQTGGTSLPVASSVGGAREVALIGLVGIGMMLLPAVMIATPFLGFARYGTRLTMLALGVFFGTEGLWLLWHSNADLGAYWAPDLALREGHVLITQGIYSRICHPMYAARFLITGAQVCLLGNWIAGPAGLAAFMLLYVIRIDHEEQMMGSAFGSDWSDYVDRTGRLIPRGKT